jgi:hypothetical protein
MSLAFLKYTFKAVKVGLSSHQSGPFYVQNSLSPVGTMCPPHLGQVFLSQTMILSLPQRRHKSADLGAERWGHVADDSPYDEILDGVAVGTEHGRDVLAEETVTFVHVGFIAALPAMILFLLCHAAKVTKRNETAK